MSDPELKELESRLVGQAWRANAIGFGVLWAFTGLAWFGVLRAPLVYGILAGAAIGVGWAAVVTLAARNASEAVASVGIRSAFGGLGTILALAGFLVWLIR